VFVLLLCVYNIYGTRKLAWCEQFLKDTRGNGRVVRGGGRRTTNGCYATARNSSGKTSAFPYFLLVDVKELSLGKVRLGGRVVPLCLAYYSPVNKLSGQIQIFTVYVYVYTKYKRKSYTYDETVFSCNCLFYIIDSYTILFLFIRLPQSSTLHIFQLQATDF